MRNSDERISDDNAIYAFTLGVYRLELKETLGRVKPKTIVHLMQIANEWADGEDSILNERGEGPAETGDQGTWSRRNNDRRRKRKMRAYDENDGAELVAACFPGSHEQRNCADSRYEHGSRAVGRKEEKNTRHE